MPQPTFVHLHVHSHYSLLDGVGKIDELIDIAKEHNAPAIALTDHGVMYGAIEFYQKCRKAGIKPIIGVEFYVAPTSRYDKRSQIERSYHLILLAKNDIGNGFFHCNVHKAKAPTNKDDTVNAPTDIIAIILKFLSS